MRFRDREGRENGYVALDLRTRLEVQEDSTFEVPESHQDPTTIQRLIDAGHEPVDPEVLEPDTSQESEEEDEPEEDEDVEEEDEDEVEVPSDLEDLNRSQLYQLGQDLGLPLEWSGEDSHSTEEMREIIREDQGG